MMLSLTTKVTGKRAVIPEDDAVTEFSLHLVLTLITRPHWCEWAGTDGQQVLSKI